MCVQRSPRSRSPRLSPRAHSATAALAALWVGCAADAETTPTPTLPPESTPRPTQAPDVTPFPGGGVQTGADQQPQDVVEVREVGLWYLSPPGGPWDAMTGSLTHSEHVNDSEEPSCEQVFALTGALWPQSGCSGCLVSIQVEHRLVDSFGACVGPDAPTHQELREEGYNETSRAVLLNYMSSGTWLKWYDATRLGDTIDFDWVREFGYFPPEEDN